jgi:glycosyltransferase involved in cell wall biosynthesis
MRLLYALDTYRPNIDGVAISSERIAKGLARRGHKVGVIAPGRRFADYEEAVEGLPVFRVRSLKVFSDRWWVPVMPGSNVERAIAYYRPDVVVVTLPFLLSRAAVGAARRLEVPVVGVTGTMPEWLTANLPLPRGIAAKANPALWRHIAHYYDQCEAVVGVTRTALRLLQDHGLTRPGHVISNGVSLRRFRPRARQADLAARFKIDERPTVLYTGRLDAEKRMDLWLEAAALIRQSGIDAQFLIVGDGSEVKHLSHLAEKLDLGDNVKFLGFLDDEDYAGVFSLADAFAIASPAELQSIVTLEAAASGLPIVAVNAGALPELVEDGGNGYLFALDDAEEMATALQRLLSDLPAARQMGGHSRMVALEHDIERTVDHYERLFLSIGGEGEGLWDEQLPKPASRGYSTARGA